MRIFQYVIELNEPINVLSELSIVQFDTQKYLVREKMPNINWKKNEYTQRVIIFDSSKNEFHNYDEKIKETNLYKNYDYFDGCSIMEQIELLKYRDKMDDINNLEKNDQIYDILEDEEHPYYNMSVNKLENIFDTEFVNQYKFTEHERHIINLVTSHPLVKNKIKSVKWIDKIIY